LTRGEGLLIGEVARACGVSVRTVRYYEQLGLLHPTGRTDSGWRLYTEPVVEHLKEILRLKELGFRLNDIGEAYRLREEDRGRPLAERYDMKIRMLHALRAAWRP